MAAGSVEAVLAASGPDLEGTGAMIYCATTDEVIWDKNSDKQYNLASITKLMTCLIAAEQLGTDTVVTVDKEATNVKKVKSVVYEGEKITVENLLYEALLVSANDAAKALAIATAGSEEKFAVMMNERAAAIGCTKTNFVNSSGVKVAGHGSSAKDVALIAAEAFKNAKGEFRIPASGHLDITELLHHERPYDHAYGNQNAVILLQLIKMFSQKHSRKHKSAGSH